MFYSKFATRLTQFGERNMDNGRSRKTRPTSVNMGKPHINHHRRYLTECGETAKLIAFDKSVAHAKQTGQRLTLP